MESPPIKGAILCANHEHDDDDDDDAGDDDDGDDDDGYDGDDDDADEEEEIEQRWCVNFEKYLEYIPLKDGDQIIKNAYF